MKTVYILTFGTRDVQIKKNDLFRSQNIKLVDNEKLVLDHNREKYEICITENNNFGDYFLLKSPRKDGELILNNFEYFKDIIIFPLIYPIFENQLITENHKIILVYTDQNQEPFRNGDSLYYAQIFKKFLSYKKNVVNQDIFHDFSVKENLVNIDFQYSFFDKAIKEKILIPFNNNEEISNIVLLAQGGIDQINTALTLQLIKHFGNKVKILQVKESKDEIKENELKFAYIFTRDLLFDKIIQLVNRGDYTGALEMIKSFEPNNENYKDLKAWIEFADLRSRFMFNILNNFGKKKFSVQKIPDFIEKIKRKQNSASDSLNKIFNDQTYSYVVSKNSKEVYTFPICERFEKCRFLFENDIKEDAILNLQIATETFLQNFVNQCFNVDITGDQYLKNKDKVLKIIKEESNLSLSINKIFQEYFSRGTKNEIKDLTPPALFSIIMGIKIDPEKIKSTEDNIIIKLAELNSNFKSSIVGLDKLRNKIAHQGEGISDNEYNDVKNHFTNLIKLILKDDSYSYNNMNNYIIQCIENSKNTL